MEIGDFGGILLAIFVKAGENRTDGEEIEELDETQEAAAEAEAGDPAERGCNKQTDR